MAVHEDRQRVNAVITMLALLALVFPFSSATSAQSWKMQPVPISTRWAASVNPDNVWPEYPRPQMVRANWENLNGLWDYAITAVDAPAPDRYAGQILVPYPVESALSGVQKPLQPGELLWYRRTIKFTPVLNGERVLLHFGAVDFEATVYLNDEELGTHSGGYQSFTFDVTDALKPGSNELKVKVHDPTERGINPHGKQNLNAQWMYYTASSGIWQTVWLERVPATHVRSLKLTPDIDRGELRVEVLLNNDSKTHSVEVLARQGDTVVARRVISGAGVLSIPRARLWSPDDPYLYDFEVRVLHRGTVIDVVKSYFGMRKIELKADGEGRARIHLNNANTFNLGVVDQGFWPESLYAAPSDAALKFDVQTIKALGFNTVRKHIKIEPQRWYHHCDKLGLLVWQDMPKSNNDSPQARVQFEKELEQNIAQLHNHPSITTWVLFNEGWGAYDVPRLVERMKHLDPSRLVNGHSGPYNQIDHSQYIRTLPPARTLWLYGGPFRPVFDDFQALQYRATPDWAAGQMLDLHFYPGPKMFAPRAGVASVTGEHGSYGVYIDGHVWNELKTVGAGLGDSNLTPQQFLRAYADSTAQLKKLEAQGLTGSTYFQIFDVESEHQGLVTYDRAITKVPVAEIERLNATLVPRARNYAVSTAGFVVAPADMTPESNVYEQLVAEFRGGQRDLRFLQRLALMAIRQKDALQAAATADAFIKAAPRPYTRETWQTILAITHTTKSESFKFLRERAAEIDAVVGPEEAEKKIIEIVHRELVVPYFNSPERKQSWAEFQRSAAAQYGEFGREAVQGAQMMEAAVKGDWPNFGDCYARYYEKATARSSYITHALSYLVLTRVSDPSVVEAAVRVMAWQVNSPRESPIFGRYDPVELDTYANLLHKAGRTAEALEWQQKAVALSDGRHPWMADNLLKMKVGFTSSLRN